MRHKVTERILSSVSLHVVNMVLAAVTAGCAHSHSTLRCNPMAGVPSPLLSSAVSRQMPIWTPPHEDAGGGRGILPLYPERSMPIGTTALQRRLSSQSGCGRGHIAGSSWKVPMTAWNSAIPATSGKSSRVTMRGYFREFGRGIANPIAYLWQTMADGQFQTGKPNRPPTFVWRMPITRRRYQLIHEYVMQRTVQPIRPKERKLHRSGGRDSGAGGHQPDPPHTPHPAAGNEVFWQDAACLDGSPLPHTGVRHA